MSQPFRFASVAVRKPRLEVVEQINFDTPLSEPQANIENTVAEAVRELRIRQKIECPVAIQMSGQSALLRPLKLPPVEASKIPDIVHYEARQNIPFALTAVEWRADVLPHDEEEGYALETEVILTAVKRDQLDRVLKPFICNEIFPDLVQLQPLALVNYLWCTKLGHRPIGDYVLAIEAGAQATTLLITNGARVWTRSIPIGGFHFTKQLSREFKLTSKKAEQLKCDAMHADDPKALFMTLRPIFQDFLSEIQRSVGFFLANTKGAEIKEVAYFGNAFQLPGLKLYVQRALDMQELVVDPRDFLEGEALHAPDFDKAYPSLATAVNLGLERLGIGMMKANFAPRGFEPIDVARKVGRILSLGRFFNRHRLPSGKRLSRTNVAWGIDVGTTGLRAVRVRAAA